MFAYRKRRIPFRIHLETSLNPWDWCFFFFFFFCRQKAQFILEQFVTSWGSSLPVYRRVWLQKELRIGQGICQIRPQGKEQRCRAHAVKVSGESAPSAVLLSLLLKIPFDTSSKASHRRPTLIISKPRAFDLKPGWNFGSRLDQPAILQDRSGAVKWMLVITRLPHCRQMWVWHLLIWQPLWQKAYLPKLEKNLHFTVASRSFLSVSTS